MKLKMNSSITMGEKTNKQTHRSTAEQKESKPQVLPLAQTPSSSAAGLKHLEYLSRIMLLGLLWGRSMWKAVGRVCQMAASVVNKNSLSSAH